MLTAPRSIAQRERIRRNTRAFQSARGLRVEDCLFPQNFKPNPGAQEKIFTDFFSLDPLTPHPLTIEDGRKVVYYRGGVNSGKSFSGAGFICSNAQKDPDARQLVTANSYGQLRTSTLVALADFCKIFRVPLSPVADVPIDDGIWADLTAKKIADARFCSIFGAPILVLSAESFTGRTANSKEVGRGLQVRAFWADEFAYADESAFLTLMTRLGRGPGVLPGVGLITSSINKNNPYNWTYDLFDSPTRSEEKAKYYISVRGSSSENIYADADYVSSMAATLTTELAKIELEGEYSVTSTGIIYNTFSRDLHALSGDDAKIVEYKPSYPIHLSFDFNHNPACAIAAQIVDDEMLILREWYLEDSDTFELSANVARWVQVEWAASVHSAKEVIVHGDASGNQRTANSRKTNWRIVWDTLAKNGISGQKRYKKANPSIFDSVNALKISFKNDRIFMNAIWCPELVKDCEVLKWKESASKIEIDKKDIKRSHLQDCLRYLNWDIWPYTGVNRAPQRVGSRLTGVVL